MPSNYMTHSNTGEDYGFHGTTNSKGLEHRLALLGHIYTPKNNGGNLYSLILHDPWGLFRVRPFPWSIRTKYWHKREHANAIQMECVLFERPMLKFFKLRISAPLYLMSFFGKLVHRTRLYKWYGRERAFAFKREELEIREGLVATTNLLHNDIYNEGSTRGSQYVKGQNEGIEKRNAKGATIKSRVQWK